MPGTQNTALGAYLALIGLGILWEGWFAPSSYAPQFWFLVKTAPLVVLLYGLVRGSAKIYLLACLLILLYFSEGVVLSYVHAGARWTWTGVRFFAALEIALTLAFFFSATWYVRQKGRVCIRAREASQIIEPRQDPRKHQPQ